MKKKEILEKLPYDPPFLFVEELLKINEDGVEGKYTLKTDEYFYKGHFKEKPVTPGVILTEIMAQIGLVCLGIYLISDIAEENYNKIGVAMSSTAIDFYKPVFPGESVTVISEKQYFRFNKLKCKVSMYTQENKLVAKGIISGMIKPWRNG